MEIDKYQQLAMRTAKTGDQIYDLRHAALGLASEVGEFTTTIKRVAIYDVDLTQSMLDNLVEELGDILWYVSLAANAINTNLSAIAGANLRKLSKRYPERYTNEAAEFRADKQEQV
jgi:NTP pyrophosphatase (non-canonical NTP hydrolase)